MKVKPWCIQNNGNCTTCSLSNYERDCVGIFIQKPLKTRDTLKKEPSKKMEN
jgi:hypothetical protein